MVRVPLSRADLRAAAQHIARNRMAAGYDLVFPAELKVGPVRGRTATKVYELLRGGRYRPMKAKKGRLPRPGKPPRIHAIPTVRDAIVLRAAVSKLWAVWDTFPKAIVGGRPGGDPRHIIVAISRFLAGGPGWMLRFDIRDCFGSAPFDKAVTALRERTALQEVVDLLVKWRAAQGTRFRGLVEGATFGPLLLAVLLAPTVSKLEKLGVARLFLDDGIFLSRSERTVREAARRLTEGLAGIGGMELHPKKTVITAVGGTTKVSDWSFLGFRWRGWIPEPHPEAVDELIAALVRTAKGGGTPADIEAVVSGWAAYYVRPDTSLLVLGEVDDRIQEEVALPYWASGPYPSLVALAEGAAVLRGPRGPRTKHRKVFGTSGGGWR